MHLVGFTIEIYYDARSYKRQTSLLYVFSISIAAQDVVCSGPKKGDILSILCQFEQCKNQIWQVTAGCFQKVAY